MRFQDFDRFLVEEREDRVLGSGRVRVYRLPNGYGLNGINTPLARNFPYDWEFAVLEPDLGHPSGFGDVVFDTPLTSTVAVCRSGAETLAFLRAALDWALNFTAVRQASAQEDRASA